MPAADPKMPALDSLVGDAASPEALSRLSRASRPARRAVGKKAGRSPAASRATLLLQSSLKAIAAQDYAEASQLALKALKLDERSGLAWHILAIAQEKAGDLVQAFTAYEAAVRLSADEATVAFDLGRLAHRLGYLEIAEKLLTRYLSRHPGNVEATNNLACALRDQNRYDEAIEILRDVIGIHPTEPILWNSLGTVLSERGDAAQSLPFYDEALRLDPDFYKARYNRANVRMGLGQPLLAIADIDEALTGVTAPTEVATMKMAKALTQMAVGQLDQAFDTYEVRLDTALADAVTFAPGGERWAPGNTLAGRTLLVYGEQGLGDEILFANPLGDVVEALGPDGTLILAVEHRLVSLFQRSYPSATVVRHRSVRHLGRLYRAADLPDPVPPIDLWTPMASLFRQFRTRAEAFPATRGFLTPDPDRVAHWRDVLAGAGPGLNVGVLWKSLIMKGARVRVYSPFEMWRPVLSVPGVRFVNLQYGDASAELEAARAAGLEIWTPPGIDLKDDLDDLAALCAALDLVIGPATATTNIAAACGAPVWMTSTGEAWSGFGPKGYLCYPTVEVFRTAVLGEWAEVMDRIATALSAEVAQRHAA
jgi:tetratricopeptide (TPR) repeat protein